MMIRLQYATFFFSESNEKSGTGKKIVMDESVSFLDAVEIKRYN